MFNAKLIQSRSGYYRLRSRQNLYQIIPGFFLGALIAAFGDKRVGREWARSYQSYA